MAVKILDTGKWGWITMLVIVWMAFGPNVFQEYYKAKAGYERCTSDHYMFIEECFDTNVEEEED